MIFSCDKVEAIGTKICNTCLTLQATAKSNADMEELKFVENTLRRLTPRINAAGFVVINRILLFSICSAVTTYIIVGLQLHVTYRDQRLMNNHT